ncbi:MAG: hypothetical protein OIN86_13540 [Candidatus Methanoperedens sp.]|nr:hypothetical protein [Candidatus Methanoperedens sp.]CAG0950386.1 hypothetical protein METP1_00165 [Methanosarcinales archaeon]
MNENKDSGADALKDDLSVLEFHKILDCTIEELLEKAWQEKWKIKHIEFWLNVKNSQNLERLAKKLPVMT